MAIVKNTLIIGSATIIAQLIALSFQPLLKKLYSVQDFGEFQLYLNLVSFSSVLFTLKMEYFLFQVRSLRLFSIISFGIVLFSFVIFLVVFPVILIVFIYFLHNYEYADLEFCSLIIIGGLFTAIYRFSLLKSSLSGNYYEIARARISRRISEGILQALLHKFGFVGLSIGELFGNIIFSITSINFRNVWSQKIFIQNMKCLCNHTFLFVKRNRKLALRKSITDIIDVWSESILVFAISIYASFQYLGYFELSYRLLIGPMALIAASVSPIIIGTAKKNLRKKETSIKDFSSLFFILLVFAIVIFILHVFFTEIFIIYFFGKDWLPVVKLIDILLLNILFQFVISPFGETLVINNRLHWDANWKFSRALVLSLILLPIGTGIEERMILFCYLNISFYIIYLYLIIKCINESRNIEA